MAISFTQYLRPDGRPRPISICMPEATEALAREFENAGGWYEAEVLADNSVSLTACMEVDGEEEDVCCEIAANGPGIKEAVDRLVRASCRWLATVPAVATEEG